MGSARRYDYPALKKQFITGMMSVRELCRVNEIPVNSQSGVIRIAREEKWQDLRDEYQGRTTEKTIDLLADREARRNLRVAEVIDNAIDMTDEMVTQVRGRLKTRRRVVTGRDAKGKEIVEYIPELVVAPKDLGKLLTGLHDLAGIRRAGPSGDSSGGSGDGSGNVNIHLPAGGQFRLLADYVDQVRSTGGPVDEEAAPEGTPAAIPVSSGAS